MRHACCRWRVALRAVRGDGRAGRALVNLGRAVGCRRAQRAQRGQQGVRLGYIVVYMAVVGALHA